jgi:hypothetical protein
VTSLEDFLRSHESHLKEQNDEEPQEIAGNAEYTEILYNLLLLFLHSTWKILKDKLIIFKLYHRTPF